MVKKDPEYKPLLFTTTMRNPLRIKWFLNVLYNYNGQILTDKLAVEIMGRILQLGLYRPSNKTEDIINNFGTKKLSKNSKIGKKILSDDQINYLLEHNPQDHDEAGFEHGWSSRFATVYDFPKELGFVYFNIGEKITFSEIGITLANLIGISIDKHGNITSEERNLEMESKIFLHALTKYQRVNPFIRVLNENAPLILLLQVIKLLNSDKNYNVAGISVLELPFLLFWKDNNAQALYERIVKLRTEYGYAPSDEIIENICEEEFSIKKTKSSIKSKIKEYKDDFLKKITITGIFILEENKTFINIKEVEKIDYILENYSQYRKFSTEIEYFNYVSTIDNELLK